MSKHPCPLISVIVPIYNVGRYLSKCIDSILGQSYPNIELILINDGSTDNSGLICKEYETRYCGRVKYLYQDNSGCSSARNAGISHSQGDWISFIDGDDSIPENYYEELVNVASASSDAGFVFCGLHFSYEQGMRRLFQFKSDTFDVNLDLVNIFPPLINSSCNKLFSRDFVIGNGVFFPVNTHFSEDMAFVLKCLAVRPVAKFVQGVYYSYNVHSGGITSRITPDLILRFCDETFITYSDVRAYYSKHGCDEQPLQIQIIRSFVPDFFHRLSVLVNQDKKFNCAGYIKYFESKLVEIANDSTLQQYRKKRNKYLFKISVYRYSFWMISLYQLVKRIKFRILGLVR